MTRAVLALTCVLLALPFLLPAAHAAAKAPEPVALERVFVPADEWGGLIGSGTPRRYLSLDEVEALVQEDLRFRTERHEEALKAWKEKRAGLGRPWYAEKVEFLVLVDPTRLSEGASGWEAQAPAEDAEWKPGFARVRARFTLKVLEKGWHRLRLLAGPLAVRELSVNGAEARLLSAGDGPSKPHQAMMQQAIQQDEARAEQTFDLLVHDGGDRVVELVFDVAVNEVDFYHALAFQALPAPSGTLEVLLPSGRLEVACGACLSPKKSERKGLTRLAAPLVPSERIDLQWFRLSRHAERNPAAADETTNPDATEGRFAITEAPLESPQLLAEILQEAAVGEGRIGGRLTVAATIRRSPLDRLRLRLPEAVKHVSLVPQPDLVASHRRVDQDLEILFRSPRQGAIRLDFDYAVEAGSSSFEADVPLFRLADATRQSTWIAVHRRTNVRIRTLVPAADEAETDETNHLEAVPLDGLPDEIRAQASALQPLSLYRALRDPARLRLEVTRYPDAAIQDRVIDLARASTVFTPDGGRLSRITWWMRSQGRDFLAVDRRMAMAEGETPIVVETATVSGKAASLKEDETGLLLVPLKDAPADGATRAFPVEITYRQRRAPLPRSGRVSHALVAVDAPILELHWTWMLPADLACTDFGGNVLAYRRAPYLKRPATLVYSDRQEAQSGQSHEPPLDSRISTRSIQFYQKAVPAATGDGKTGRIQAEARVMPSWMPTALHMLLFLVGLGIGRLATRVLFRGESPGSHLVPLALAFVAVAIFQDVDGFAPSLLGGVALTFTLTVLWGATTWALGLARAVVVWPFHAMQRAAATPTGVTIPSVPSVEEDGDPEFIDESPDEAAPPETLPADAPPDETPSDDGNDGNDANKGDEGNDDDGEDDDPKGGEAR